MAQRRWPVLTRSEHERRVSISRMITEPPQVGKKATDNAFVDETRIAVPPSAMPPAPGRYVRPHSVQSPRMVISARTDQRMARDDAWWFAAVRDQAPKPKTGGRVGNFTHTALSQLSDSAQSSVLEQLSTWIVANRARVMDLFREWDVDGYGTVDFVEFCDAMRALGHQASETDLASLFATFDVNSDGEISFAELHKVLRQTIPNRRPGRATGVLLSPRASALWLPREVGKPPNGIVPPNNIMIKYRQRTKKEPDKPLHALRMLPPLEPQFLG